MNVVIRAGEERDFPVLMELIRGLATFEKSSHLVKNSVDQMRQEKEWFGSFVAEEDGKIIGAAIYFFGYYTWVGKSLYLDDLYVRPEYRRKKVGTMLLKRVFEFAKQENCKRLRWQVLGWNRDAISFYEKHGATIDDEWLNCDFDEDGIERFLKSDPR